MKDMYRILEIKESRNFQEIVDCCYCCCTCEDVSTTDSVIFRCEKHKMEVHKFSKCDDYEFQGIDSKLKLKETRKMESSTMKLTVLGNIILLVEILVILYICVFMYFNQGVNQRINTYSKLYVIQFLQGLLCVQQQQ